MFMCKNGCAVLLPEAAFAIRRPVSKKQLEAWIYF